MATYALVETLPIEIRHPLGFGWAETATTAKWLVELTNTNGDVLWTAKLCSLATPATFGAQTSYPDSFIAATPLRVRAGRIHEGQFTSGPHVEVLGASDDDGDGNPGVTVSIAHKRVGQGDVWVQQEATLNYAGLLDGDSIHGTVSWAPHQTLLGATTWWLRIPVKQRISSDGAFAMTPLAEASCDAVEAL